MRFPFCEGSGAPKIRRKICETAKKDVFAVLFRILCPCFVSVPEWADGRERGVPQWGKDPWGRVLIKREKTRKNGKSAALRRNG
jgi:hypothetical protein